MPNPKHITHTKFAEMCERLETRIAAPTMSRDHAIMKIQAAANLAEFGRVWRLFAGELMDNIDHPERPDISEMFEHAVELAASPMIQSTLEDSPDAA